MDLKKIEDKYINCDVKAEVVAADLIEAGAKADDIVIRPMGLFSRKFRKDILQYQEPDGNNGANDNMLFIDVSREGLFDSLPQRLFYQANLAKQNSSTEAKLDEFRKQREEEKESRRFFLVFEKEFNHCKTLVELEERKSIFGMSEQFNSDLFTDIWVELKDINPKFHKYLFQILPLAHKCRGDVHLSGMLLGLVLNVPVNITVFSDPVMRKNQLTANRLGKQYLGADFIVGDETPAYDPLYKVTVGPIKRQNMRHYMYGGDYKKVIEFLMDYFIPFDADFEIDLMLEKEAENLLLCDSESYCFLGFDTKI